MSRIIKLTESQLRDMVQRTIQEQAASLSTSPAAKQIWTKLSTAQAGMGGAGGTDETALISAISMIKSVELYTEVVNMMRGGSSIGNYKSIVQLLNGELESDNLKEFQQIAAILKKIGVTLTAKTRKGGQHVGAERGATYQYDELVPGSIRQVVGKTAPVVDPYKPTYRLCKGFPIKYGCKQTEVGRLQQCLGLSVDYSFGPNTLKAFLDLNPDPNARGPVQKQIVQIGLSEGAYNAVIAKCKYKPKPKKQQVTPAPAPVVDTRDKTAPLTIATRTPQLMPVNIDIPKLAAIPTPGIDQARKDAIVAQIKDRGFDQVYKGQKLTPEEKQWLDYYMSLTYGSQVDKTKPKGDDNEKIRYDNK